MGVNKKADGWDWAWFKYGGTVILRKTEEQFWKMTPREFNVLMKVHIDINSNKKKENPMGYIDQVL